MEPRFIDRANRNVWCVVIVCSLVEAGRFVRTGRTQCSVIIALHIVLTSVYTILLELYFLVRGSVCLLKQMIYCMRAFELPFWDLIKIN